jgi:PTH1 family peptidyl-tRNA hydrolase
MKLIIGLGNISNEYIGTRHNAGFNMLEHVAEEFGASWHDKPKFKAIVAEARLGAQKIILAKPTTYYNLSGEAAQAIMSFYKLDVENVLVIHDELALPFGTIRARIGGSDAGNNGIKSLNAHIGELYARVRIGIANTQATKQKAEQFVLEPFSDDERQTLSTLATHVVRFVEDFVHEDKSFEHTSVSFVSK